MAEDKTTLDFDKIEALARAATPGPWVAAQWTCRAETTVMSADTAKIIAETTGFGRHSDDCAVDAAFIAAANPAVVLQLAALARSAAPAPSLPDVAMPEQTCQPEWEKDIGNAGETVVRCKNYLAFQGRPCMRLANTPVARELDADAERRAFEAYARKACQIPEGVAVNWNATWTRDSWDVWLAARQATAESAPASAAPDEQRQEECNAALRAAPAGQHVIDLNGFGTLKREYRTTGEVGWLIYDAEEKLLRGLSSAECELVDCVWRDGWMEGMGGAGEIMAEDEPAHDWCKCGNDRKHAVYHGTDRCWLSGE